MIENESIIAVYHYFFLFLAFMVAVLAIGASTKLWIFRNISVVHQNALISTFLVGAALAVVTNYESLPSLEIKRAEHYIFSLDYYDNFSSLYYSSHQYDSYMKCFQSHLVDTNVTLFSNKNDVNLTTCVKLEKNIKNLKKELSTRGMGEMFLSLSKKADLYRGLVSYSFPNDDRAISMTLDGVKVDENQIEMNFIQPGRYKVKLRPVPNEVIKKEVNVSKELFSKEFDERPPFSFSISFNKCDRSEIFKGVLYHPDVTVDCRLLGQDKERGTCAAMPIMSPELLHPQKKHVLNNPSNRIPQCYAPLAIASIAPTY